MSAGLCQTCAHRRAVPNTRGSVFTLCLRSKSDPDYPRYPRLPVERCPGYEVRTPAGSPAPSAAGSPAPSAAGSLAPSAAGSAAPSAAGSAGEGVPPGRSAADAG